VEGAPPPFCGGERGPHLTKSPGRRPTSIPRDILIHAAIWPQQIWADKWGVCSFGEGRGGAGSPSNTLWPGPRPACVPSFILIHPTVWPQCTYVTETGQDNRFINGRPKTVRLDYRSVVCLSCLSVCNVGVLWPKGWTDPDETWHAGRPRPWQHCVRWRPSSPPSPKG